MTTYSVSCHVCGREWELETDFLSAPTVRVGGRDRALVACREHTAAEVRQAWLELGSPADRRVRRRRLLGRLARH